MDTISAADLARGLDTSVPRVTRAVERLGLDARQANGRLALTQRQAQRVRAVLGVTPRAAGLTRPETTVLAALRSAPFGLVSRRAVSRRSGLSPTAATRALESLLAKGLLLRTEETIASGQARKTEVWRANVAHPRWAELDPVLARVEPPERAEPSTDRVPRHLRHLFWNTAESQLQPSHSGAYIARRLLQTMDLQGLAWGAQILKPEDWERGSKARGLDPKVKRLARNLAENPR
jgi:DNA-binding MarR family transcriptional regulator